VLETEWGIDGASLQQDINGLLKFGVMKDLELRVANDPFLADSGTHGVGDTAVGFKYRFKLESGLKPSLAFMYMAKIPTAGDPLGSGEVDHSFTFLASNDFGKHHFDFNSVVNLLGRPQGGFDHDFQNELAWSHPVRGKWSVTVELSGANSPNAFTRASAQFLASAIYTVRPRLVLDCGMAARITGDIPDATFIAGFTYSIGRFYRDERKPVEGRPHRP
jgi:hypothetical protein